MRAALYSVVAVTALAVTAGVSLAQQAPPPPPPLVADLILSGGQIYTPDGWAQALAIRDGVIIAVGDEGTVAPHRTTDTNVIALDGATVLPGLHDNHVHAMGAGMAQLQCSFPQGSSLEVVLETVRACAAAREPGEWITGGQWDTSSLGQPPHRTLLDSVAPDNPVLLTDISYHSGWANSLALELSNIDANTPTPPGGVIERDADGSPTGVFRETARGLVRAQGAELTAEDIARSLKWSLDHMLSYGITSYTDAGVDPGGLGVYALLADRGDLKQRVRGCIGVNAPALVAGGIAATPLARANLYARERFNPDCVKLALDGVPTDGHTAAMVEPYAGGHDHEHGDTGIVMIPQDVLNAALIELDARGYTVKMHAAGDAAVRAGLDAIEATRAANGFTGNLHDLAHNSFVQLSDIQRARGLAATFEMSPYIWFPNPIIPDIAAAIGPERMLRWTPVKDAIDAGALVVPGSDWSVVPSVNPWIAIETLVTRQAPGGGGEMLGASQRITLEQAIDLFTVNSARQMGNAHRTGAIVPGLLADVIVLDRNPFDIPITEVHRINTQMTLIGGEIVYRASQ